MNLDQMTRRLTTAGLLAAALTLSLPAMGQVRVQGGAAHDANQRVGGGGYNGAIRQPDYASRNLLITGNVGGGRAFRGSVGYTAPGAFRGALGSDSLFGFNRDSIYSAPGAGSLGTRQLGNRVIVTRPTTSIPGYRMNTGTGLSTRTTYDPRAGVVTFRQSGGGLVAISGVNDISQFRRQTGRYGTIRTPGGGTSIDPARNPNASPDPLRANPSTSPGANPPANPEPQPQGTPPAGTNPLNPATTPGTGVPGKQENKPVDGSTTNLNVNSYPLAITLGAQLQSVMASKIAGLENKNLTADQARAIRMQLFGKAQTAAPGQDPKNQAPTNPYAKLISDILAQTDEQAKAAADDKAADADKKAAAQDKPHWQKILEEPKKTVLDAKKKAREAALRVSLGIVDANGQPDFEKPLPGIDPESELGKILKALDYDLPAIHTLAGERKTRVNTLMSRGESELAAGRYIIAETIYRQVARETKGAPLAQAGLIHSQMGAGMIRSAAFNLRSLFARHPELVALRYEKKLLPADQRLTWLQGQLQEMIDKDKRVGDPAVVMAYLGYQLRSKKLVEYGLSIAEAENPRDPLLPVLRKIWLKPDKQQDGKDKDATDSSKPKGDESK